MSRLIGDRGDWRKIERNSELIERLNREAKESKPDVNVKSRQEPEQPRDFVNAPNLDSFVFVPSTGIYLAKERSLNNESWNQAIDKIYNKGITAAGMRAEMPTPYEFMSGLIYILDNKNIPNLSGTERTEFLDDTLALKNVYRGNHLNARFADNAMEIATIKNGKLEWMTLPLSSCLQKNCYADLRKINSRGLLTTEATKQEYVKGETAYFWKPVNGSVARFVANSGRAYLNCSGHPGNSYASLGVRLVVRPKGVSAKNK